MPTKPLTKKTLRALCGSLMHTRPISNRAFLIPHCAFLILIASCSEILSPDITTKTLTINSPKDSTYTNGTTTFWWELDENIEQYQLRLTYFTNGNLNLLVDTTFVTNTYFRNFTQDNAYQWQVRGKNEGSETNWIQGTLFIDRTTPDKATATNMDGDTLLVGTTDSIQWTSTDYPLNGVTYPVSDSLILYRKNDSTTIGAKIYYAPTARRTLTVTATTPNPLNGPGKYHWRIVTIDKAGNRQTSDYFQFIVQ